MKLKIKITDLKTVNELDFYWLPEDYINLLKEFDYPDADQISPDEVLDYLYMSITDFEPEEAAEVVLKYKMSDKLKVGQIKNLSNEMLEDKVAEEYADPALHFDLFNINQLLYKAFKGIFPNTEATIISVYFQEKIDFEITKEILVKSLSAGLKKDNLLTRLYEEQIFGTEPFTDAEKVIWYFRKMNENEIEIITSKYWIEEEDFELTEFTAKINFYEED